MKEDAQLVCPVAFEDPSDIWTSIQNEVLDRLPLEGVSWKNPITSMITTINRLPLRFLPSSANLFKDTDHPFRWFLAPYVHIFFIKAETMDSYKAMKQTLKQWVDSQIGIRRLSWLIVYVPSGGQTFEHYNKIASKINSDFYTEKPGDRSITLQTPSALRSQNLQDFLVKTRECIVASFQQRCALYDTEIRKLDSFRGSAQMEFRQLFLVKESLALMFQMMQLPNEALLVYEELEALLQFTPQNFLPEPEWPWVLIDPKSSSSSSSSRSSMSSSITTKPSSLGEQPIGDDFEKPEKIEATGSNNSSSTGGSQSAGREMDGWLSCCRNGDEILHYSMNISRIRILKNRMSLWELMKYVFARQMHFLLIVGNVARAAEKTIEFITNMRNDMDKKLYETLLMYYNSNPNVSGASQASASASSGGSIGSIYNSSNATEKTQANPNSQSIHSNFIFNSGDSKHDNDEMHEKIRSKSLQADLFVSVSCVKIARACRDTIFTTYSGLNDKFDASLMMGMKEVTRLLQYAIGRLSNILPSIEDCRKVSYLLSNQIDYLIDFRKNSSQTSLIPVDESTIDLSPTKKTSPHRSVECDDDCEVAIVDLLTPVLRRWQGVPRNDQLLANTPLEEMLQLVSQRLRSLALFMSSSSMRRKQDFLGTSVVSGSSVAVPSPIPLSPMAPDLNSANNNSSAPSSLSSISASQAPASTTSTVTRSAPIAINNNNSSSSSSSSQNVSSSLSFSYGVLCGSPINSLQSFIPNSELSAAANAHINGAVQPADTTPMKRPTISTNGLSLAPHAVSTPTAIPNTPTGANVGGFNQFHVSPIPSNHGTNGGPSDSMSVKLLLLESSLVVSLLRSTASMMVKTDRYRMSITQWQHICDHLIMFCNYETAALILTQLIKYMNMTAGMSQMLQAAASHSPGQTLEMLTKLPNSTLSEFIYAVLVDNNSEDGILWDNLTKTMLKKLLFCVRQINDTSSFALVTMVLVRALIQSCQKCGVSLDEYSSNIARITTNSVSSPAHLKVFDKADVKRIMQYMKEVVDFRWLSRLNFEISVEGTSSASANENTSPGKINVTRAPFHVSMHPFFEVSFPLWNQPSMKKEISHFYCVSGLSFHKEKEIENEKEKSDNNELTTAVNNTTSNDNAQCFPTNIYKTKSDKNAWIPVKLVSHLPQDIVLPLANFELTLTKLLGTNTGGAAAVDHSELFEKNFHFSQKMTYVLHPRVLNCDHKPQDCNVDATDDENVIVIRRGKNVLEFPLLDNMIGDFAITQFDITFSNSATSSNNFLTTTIPVVELKSHSTNNINKDHIIRFHGSYPPFDSYSSTGRLQSVVRINPISVKNATNVNLNSIFANIFAPHNLQSNEKSFIYNRFVINGNVHNNNNTSCVNSNQNIINSNSNSNNNVANSIRFDNRVRNVVFSIAIESTVQSNASGVAQSTSAVNNHPLLLPISEGDNSTTTSVEESFIHNASIVDDKAVLVNPDRIRNGKGKHVDHHSTTSSATGDVSEWQVFGIFGGQVMPLRYHVYHTRTQSSDDCSNSKYVKTATILIDNNNDTSSIQCDEIWVKIPVMAQHPTGTPPGQNMKIYQVSTSFFGEIRRSSNGVNSDSNCSNSNSNNHGSSSVAHSPKFVAFHSSCCESFTVRNCLEIECEKYSLLVNNSDRDLQENKKLSSRLQFTFENKSTRVMHIVGLFVHVPKKLENIVEIDMNANIALEISFDGNKEALFSSSIRKKLNGMSSASYNEQITVGKTRGYHQTIDLVYANDKTNTVAEHIKDMKLVVFFYDEMTKMKQLVSNAKDATFIEHFGKQLLSKEFSLTNFGNIANPFQNSYASSASDAKSGSNSSAGSSGNNIMSKSTVSSTATNNSKHSNNNSKNIVIKHPTLENYCKVVVDSSTTVIDEANDQTAIASAISINPDDNWNYERILNEYTIQGKRLFEFPDIHSKLLLVDMEDIVHVSYKVRFHCRMSADFKQSLQTKKSSLEIVVTILDNQTDTWFVLDKSKFHFMIPFSNLKNEGSSWHGLDLYTTEIDIKSMILASKLGYSELPTVLVEHRWLSEANKGGMCFGIDGNSNRVSLKANQFERTVVDSSDLSAFVLSKRDSVNVPNTLSYICECKLFAVHSPGNA